MIDIKLFGTFEIHDASGAPIEVSGAKTQGLIACLAMTIELPPTRDRLISLFWGDRFSDQARQSLRQAIAKLRRILPSDGPDVLVVNQDRVGFNPEVVRVDVERFGRLAASEKADDIFEAVSLLHGPVLDGFYGQHPEFEDWIASERQRLNDMAAKVLDRASAAAQKRGDLETALAHARHLTQIDPWSDAAQMVLIRLLAQSGNRAAAVQAFNSYEQTLNDELGISAGHSLCELLEQIRGEDFAARAMSAAAPQMNPKPDCSGRTAVAIQPVTSRADQCEAADGLIDDVSMKLSRFGWLDLYANLDEADTRFADRGIDYVVNGSLRSQGARHRLTLQVTDTRTGRYVWVNRFDRESDDPFALQDDLSDTAVGALENALERLEGRNARDKILAEMHSWDAYHRGVALSADFDLHANTEAQSCFRHAISLDPNFALAHARLAHAIVMSTVYHEAQDVSRLLKVAYDHAEKAAKLDPSDAFVQFALGRVLMCRGEYDQAIHNMNASISLNPNYASAYCGVADSMTYSGSYDAALPFFERAMEVCPCDSERWTLLKFGATAMMFRGDYDTAVDWATRAEAVPNATYWPTAIRAAALAHRGRLAEAQSAVSKLLKRRPGITCDFIKSRLFYLKDTAQIETYLGGLRKAGLA